jgi:transposase
MGYVHIPPEVKLIAIKLYMADAMSLRDILDCCGFSKRTFRRTWKRFHETGSVEHLPCTTRGRPRGLHFNDITYLLALIRQRPSWFLDELLDLLQANRFISVHFTTVYRELERAGRECRGFNPRVSHAFIS